MSKKPPYTIAADAQKILDADKIAQKLHRIALQIIENNYDAPQIAMIGIEDGGYFLSKKIKKIIEEKSSIKIAVSALYVNKEHPLSEKPVLRDELVLDNIPVIIVDDVANTGKTLFYALDALIHAVPTKVSVAVLIDRMHKMFPITADFVGFSLATTFTEHIIVQFTASEEAEGVYMF